MGEVVQKFTGNETYVTTCDEVVSYKFKLMAEKLHSEIHITIFM